MSEPERVTLVGNLPSRAGPAAGAAPAGRPLGGLLPDLRVPAGHRPQPGPLRAAQSPADPPVCHEVA
jgi:hypothetical protein